MKTWPTLKHNYLYVKPIPELYPFLSRNISVGQVIRVTRKGKKQQFITAPIRRRMDSPIEPEILREHFKRL